MHIHVKKLERTDCLYPLVPLLCWQPYLHSGVPLAVCNRVGHSNVAEVEAARADSRVVGVQASGNDLPAFGHGCSLDEPDGCARNVGEGYQRSRAIARRGGLKERHGA